MATPRSGPALRALRRFTLGSGPLRRGSDRVEFASRLLVLVLVLLSVPVALAVGTAVRSDLASDAAREAAQLHPVSAVATADAGSPADAALAHGSVVVPARWTAPDGHVVDEEVPAPLDTRAGDTFTLWTTSAGVPAEEPMSSLDVTVTTLVVVALGWSATLVVIALAHAALCGVLDRHRDHRWTREWAAVEPTWTRRVP
jgi:hypothetical protein